jgi:hypothetical protein
MIEEDIWREEEEVRGGDGRRREGGGRFLAREVTSSRPPDSKTCEPEVELELELNVSRHVHAQVDVQSRPTSVSLTGPPSTVYKALNLVFISDSGSEIGPPLLSPSAPHRTHAPHARTHARAHHGARSHHRTLDPECRLWCAWKSMLGHDQSRRGLATCGHYGRPLCAKHDIWRASSDNGPAARKPAQGGTRERHVRLPYDDC